MSSKTYVDLQCEVLAEEQMNATLRGDRRIPTCSFLATCNGLECTRFKRKTVYKLPLEKRYEKSAGKLS